jgi:hypothetical protein
VYTARDRLSDALLNMGTELAISRAELQRNLAAAAGRRGYAAAQSTVMLARWFDTAVLWLSWRLRPRSMPER